MLLNHLAREKVRLLIANAEEMRIAVHTGPDGCTLVDLGINVPGSLEAGRRLAEICLAGLGYVTLAPGGWRGLPLVSVRTDHPVAACMAGQYAGWQLVSGKFFAMGSGPMRAAAGKEELFQKIGCREQPECAVGVLETRKLPPEEVVRKIAQDCGVATESVFLLAAPTASQAGNLQVVARSVETALHKLFELGFDLNRVQSGWGVAPLSPLAADDLQGIGRTNDSILYGGEVTLWIQGVSDSELVRIGPQVPSCASDDHGEPFIRIFERYNKDFYKIDPHLFSPALVHFVNLDSGRTHSFGRLCPEVLDMSFGE